MKREGKTVLPDVASSGDVRMGLARIAVQQVSVEALKVRTASAQGFGAVPGARSPLGPARPPVDLVEIVEPMGDGREKRMTSVGYLTARERLPRALTVLDSAGARFQAALRYRHVVERVASIAGPGALSSAPAGRVSDGGAVYRTGIAAELRALRAVLGGVALVRGNARGLRRDVSVRALVDGVVLEGREIKGVLRVHGWSGLGLYVKTLTEALHDALSSMADVRERY